MASFVCGTVSRTEDRTVSYRKTFASWSVYSNWHPLAICGCSLFGSVGGLGRTTQACPLVSFHLGTVILVVSSVWPPGVILLIHFAPASLIYQKDIIMASLNSPKEQCQRLCRWGWNSIKGHTLNQERGIPMRTGTSHHSFRQWLPHVSGWSFHKEHFRTKTEVSQSYEGAALILSILSWFIYKCR